MKFVWFCDLSWWVFAPVFSLISNAERHNKKKKTFIQEAFFCTLHHQRKSNYPHWEILCVVSVSITQVSSITKQTLALTEKKHLHPWAKWMKWLWAVKCMKISALVVFRRSLKYKNKKLELKNMLKALALCFRDILYLPITLLLEGKKKKHTHVFLTILPRT